MKHKALLLISSIALTFGSAARAAEVEARLQAGSLSFSGGAGFSNASLLITGPNDFEVEETASRGLPVFRVQGGLMKDGFYQFSLSAATDQKVKIKRAIDNGRGADARDYTLKPFYMTGMFEISRGTIVPVDEMKSGADSDATE